MPIAQSAFGDLEHEFAQTRKMLERIPEAHLDFTPHAKSWPLRTLANHLCDFGGWGDVTVRQDVLDFADWPQETPPETTVEFLKKFDDGLARFRAALPLLTDENLMTTWTMKSGDAVFVSMPRIAVLRGMIINHMVHHRAQLTIYYRLLDVPVPGLYGPSADEQ